MKEWLNALDVAQQSGRISPDSYRNLLKWLSSREYQDYHRAIGEMIEAEDWSGLEDCFFKMIEFGTGGRRGPRGIGPNRINTRTISESAQGLSDYIHQTGDPSKGVVVAYDTRHQSLEYAGTVCEVLAGNGIKAFLYPEPRSTPQLSFSIRHLKTQAGCMISASHNPPSDNGIKVSWDDGGQVLPPHDKGIIQKVALVDRIRRIPLDQARRSGLVVDLDRSIDEEYQKNLRSLSLSASRSAKIAYSPLHGVGTTNVVRLLESLGFHLVTVPEQMRPDPDFSTVRNRLPNPELPAAMEMVTESASAEGAVVAMASDPDADRLGATIPCPSYADPSGWYFLNGNQIGVLILEHVLRKMKQAGRLAGGGLVIKTIVTTDMLDALCREYGVSVRSDLLVGFKYIAEIVNGLPGDQHVVFATEESHGYNRGTFVRDKDSAPAALHLAELACELAERGETIYSHLNGLYRRYGYYCEVTRSVYYEGKTGLEKMLQIMETLRSNPPRIVLDMPVSRITDRKTNRIIDPHTGGMIGEVRQHKGNVMIFELGPDARNRITARPSGTEPKIKFYSQVWQQVPSGIDDRVLEDLKNRTKEKAVGLINALAGQGG